MEFLPAYLPSIGRRELHTHSRYVPRIGQRKSVRCKNREHREDSVVETTSSAYTRAGQISASSVPRRFRRPARQSQLPTAKAGCSRWTGDCCRMVASCSGSRSRTGLLRILPEEQVARCSLETLPLQLQPQPSGEPAPVPHADTWARRWGLWPQRCSRVGPALWLRSERSPGCRRQTPGR